MTEWPQPLVYSYPQAVAQLSPRARQKLADLEAMVSDAEALQRSLMARIVTAERAYAEVGRRRNYAVTARRDHTELDAEVTAAARQCERLRTELGRRNATRAGNEQVLSRLRNFITALIGGMVEMNPPPSPVPKVAWQPRENEDVLAALDRVRSDIGSAQNEIARIKGAPLPAKEIKAAIAARIDAMAREGAPRVSVMGTEVSLQWPDMPIVMVPGHAFSAPGAASKLMCWLFGEKLSAELCADIEDRSGAIPAADRAPRLREIEARLYAWECGEERLVLMAQAASLDVARRASASPWALLYTTDDEREVLAAAE